MKAADNMVENHFDTNHTLPMKNALKTVNKKLCDLLAAVSHVQPN
jgi:hypothetical protein